MTSLKINLIVPRLYSDENVTFMNISKDILNITIFVSEMERKEFESCICQFEPVDNDDSIQRFHLRDCTKYSQLNVGPLKAGQFIRENKFKMRQKQRNINPIDKSHQNVNFESESDCLGNSELSHSEDDSENVKHISPLKVPRKLFAKTRQTLAEEQLENNDKGELVCLTCLKRFSNIQNLRRHLRLHLKRYSNIPDFESDSENCDNSNKRFNCDFCPEKFDNKSGFLVHEKTHNSPQLMCYVFLGG